MNTSSINSWFRWNLVRASVLVEIISFSKPSTLGANTSIPKRWNTYFLVLIWMHRRSLLESIFSAIAPVVRGARKTHTTHIASRSLFPLLSVPPFKRFHLSVLLG